MSEIRVTSVVGENGGDPVGLTTGFTVGPLTGTTGIGATITHQGHAQFAGVCTATSFSGDGSGLTGAGKILQITQGTSTTEDSFTTASFVASNLSATITPTAASSKILIQSSFLVDTKAAGRQIQVAIFRSINGGTFTNISGGNNTIAVATYAGNSRLIEQASVLRLDTPSYSVGNSIVYKLYGKSESATGLVSMQSQGNEGVIILQEVAA